MKFLTQCLQHSRKIMRKNYSVALNGMNIHPDQATSFDEPCILVNENDEIIGKASKRDCHMVGGDKSNKGLLLHRAFSVFIFNSKGEMLVQRRSSQKVTFPGEFANACCSHPLYVKEEMQEDGRDNQEENKVTAIGVKRAASRRLNFELGIPTDMTKPENFLYLTRFHYHSLSGVDDNVKTETLLRKGNPVWGEHEIDYILVLKGDMEIKPNPNEVMEVRLITRSGLVPFLESLSQKGIKITPWFHLIVKTWLPLWWDNLHQLEKFQDHHTIHRL
ncbi:hypothetical protein J437_LFUL008593 [Ladona fulva]|uniref:isopentenyl-diphosphate Delta-isomerase n=1 Tax=Ladona fulva TaxID=123851 RepID=A0A8K0K8J6_LADFU|nr:hypothetical protein J437_LFUL008593 [Ladona fulva]